MKEEVTKHAKYGAVNVKEVTKRAKYGAVNVKEVTKRAKYGTVNVEAAMKREVRNEDGECKADNEMRSGDNGL